MYFLWLPFALFFGWKLLTPKQVSDAVAGAESDAMTYLSDQTVSMLSGTPSQLSTEIPQTEPDILTSQVPVYNDGYIQQ